VLYFSIKVILSALVIVVVGEVAKRSSVFGALIASLPLTSILAMVWLYLDTGNPEKVAALASDILWLVLPSLLFFILLPVLLRNGMSFWLALGISASVTASGYALVVWLLGKFASN